MSGGPVPVWKKYTTGSLGIWEKLRQLLYLVPNRSSGNPVVSLYRVPPPGARLDEAAHYVDPQTLPTGDIAGNPYYKRDHRRHYPQVIGFNQTKVAGLLRLGSEQYPRIAKGEKGTKELLVFLTDDANVGLASALASTPANVVNGQILGISGEPIVAPSLNKFKWTLLEEPEHGMYTEQYPCRIFGEKKVSA